MQMEGHEVWSNLAFVLYGLEKEAAALSVTAEIDSQLWQIWRNLMNVNSECRNYGVMIRSYNKILTLNSKYVDEKILNSLTKEIIKNIKSCSVMCESDTRDQLLGLFNNIVQHNEGNVNVWILYAMTTACSNQSDPDIQNQTAERLLKAQTALVSDEKWYKSLGSIIKVLLSLNQLIDAYLDCCTFFGKSIETKMMLLDIKMFAIEVIDKIKGYYTDITPVRVAPTLERSLILLLNKLERIVRYS